MYNPVGIFDMETMSIVYHDGDGIYDGKPLEIYRENHKCYLALTQLVESTIVADIELYGHDNKWIGKSLSMFGSGVITADMIEEYIFLLKYYGLYEKYLAYYRTQKAKMEKQMRDRAS